MAISNMARILCISISCVVILVILFVNQGILTRTELVNRLSTKRDTRDYHHLVVRKHRMPLYPITASWFRDRFTIEEWDITLDQFTSIGGDTVWLRAPAFIPRTKEDILRDPNFEWCQYADPTTKGPVRDCVSQAETDMVQNGLVIKTFATYQYEENFSDKIQSCPQYDVKISSSRVYFRLVLPLNSVSSNPCPLDRGTEVVVLFTTFSGIDPHQLLIQSASKRGIKVYFGLPAAPLVTSGSEQILVELLPAYYNWVFRVLADHRYRYSSTLEGNGMESNNDTGTGQHDNNITLLGYYAANEICLAEISNASNHYLEMYTMLGQMVHRYGKKFVLSPYIVLNKSQRSFSAEKHVVGFEKLAKSVAVDVIAVQEGRGCAKGCYYWPFQEDVSISNVDPVLDDIVHYLDPEVREGVTYGEQFTTSNNKLFRMISDKTDELNERGVHFKFWLNIEAFEYLRADPCLPVDIGGSGMAELLQKTTKSRLDWALTVAGATPNKIISFAWDSDFTCVTKAHPVSLVGQILSDYSRAIVSACALNRTGKDKIGLLGYNLNTPGQKFQVSYRDKRGRSKSRTMKPTYIDTDYGINHDKVKTLQYVRLEFPLLSMALKPHGIVNISASEAYHECVITY